MTVRINFLPRTYLPPRQMGLREWAVAVGAGAAVVATSLFYLSVYNAITGLEQQAAVDQAKLLTYKAQVARGAEVRAREEHVARAEAELRALSGRHWSPVLLTLRDLTPQRVTWGSLTVEADTITLKGTGRSLMDVAQLLAGLVENPQVEQTEVHYVNEQGIPVTVTAKQGEKVQLEKAPADEKKAPVSPFTYRLLEFELKITLTKPERGQANGTQPA